MMKRLICFVLAFCMIAVLICGCSDKKPENTSQSTSDSTESSQSTESTESSDSTESSGSTEASESTTLEEPMKEPTSIPKSIKILAIGNSFSVDATEYLWNMLDAAGIEEVVIGNLYIGGCSLDTHWSNMSNNSNAYTFYYNNSGTWETQSKKSILYALRLEEWDYITVQQVSQDSGDPSSLGNLQNVLNYVKNNKTNDEAEIYWHMTWAYQTTSYHEHFLPDYGNSQMKMYNSIISTAKDHVSGYDLIEGIIPAGTAVQNLRTSYLDDSLSLDTYHMSYGTGRYAVALTWFSFFTGIDARYIDWVPEAYPKIAEDKAAISNAVNMAIKTPFEITSSPYTKKPVNTVEMTDADKEIISKLGYDPDDYLVLDPEMTLHAFYQSGTTSELISTKNSSNKTLPYYAASNIFRRDQLPVGTIISIAEGYQYRADAWVGLNVDTPKAIRPGLSSETVVIDDAWWGIFHYRSFIINAVTEKTTLTESDLDKIRVYIPKKTEPSSEKYSALTEDDIATLTAANLDPSKYQVLNLDLTYTAYYNSTYDPNIISGKLNLSSTAVFKLIATQLFEKSDLPNGTVISIKSGYQYRPEGWVNDTTPNASEKRPAYVTASIVTVDDAWWGNFNYRAFNICREGEKTDIVFGDGDALRIYVPKN